jgi:hypothetical protein
MSKIKGLTIAINGETTGLDKALSGVNKKSRDLQGELREVERLLKLDPGNTELLVQKQKLLTDAVAGTKEKLEAIEAAILKRALGYRIKEIVPLEIDGEVVRVEVEREIPPDTLACWLWLRHVQPQEWGYIDNETLTVVIGNSLRGV